MSNEDLNVRYQKQIIKNDNLLHNYNYSNLDPKKLFELISKNYEIWQNSMNNLFVDEDSFLPFPADHSDSESTVDPTNSKNGPIFNYSLLEALENSCLDGSNINELDLFNEIRLNLSNNKLEPSEIKESKSASNPNSTSSQTAKALSTLMANSTTDKSTTGNSTVATKPNPVHEPKLIDSKLLDLSTHIAKSSDSNRSNGMKKVGSNSLLNQLEIDFLRNKISSMINPKEGMSLYDTEDEPGLYDVSEEIDIDIVHDQDDYDVDEIIDDNNYGYDYSHHIEVELNTSNDAPFNNYEDEGPSCEFTFEYDHNGKLVPTYSNVEEKLRLMNLQSKMTQQKLNLPSTSENSTTKKKKSKKKKKKKSTEAVEEQLMSNKSGYGGNDCCLICEYELIFGSKPKQLIKWYNQRVSREDERRQEIKKKLESAKLKAMKKQQELKQRQLQQQQQLQRQELTEKAIEQASEDDEALEEEQELEEALKEI